MNEDDAGLILQPGDRVEHVLSGLSGRILSVNGDLVTWEPFGSHQRRTCHMNDLALPVTDVDDARTD